MGFCGLCFPFVAQRATEQLRSSIVTRCLVVGPFSQNPLSYFSFFIFTLDIIQNNCLFRKNFRIFWTVLWVSFLKFSCVPQNAVVTTGKCVCTFQIILAAKSQQDGKRNQPGWPGPVGAFFVLLCGFGQKGWSRWSPEISSNVGYSRAMFLQPMYEAG